MITCLTTSCSCEGIDSERGLEWRCADSLSLREFLRLGEREPVPDHSWLSRTRARLPLEVHDAVFSWVLQRLAERGLIKGERIEVDASTVEANAALRAIVRRDSGEGYREMLVRMAKESGIETPMYRTRFPGHLALLWHFKSMPGRLCRRYADRNRFYAAA